MFVRTKISPNGKTKIQIVESVRKSDKVRQKILRHVGTVSTPSEVDRFKQMAEYIKAEMEKEVEPTLFESGTLADMVVASRKTSGEDTYEGKTFRNAIDQIKKRFNVKRAIVVADSGLLSKENISLLEEERKDREKSIESLKEKIENASNPKKLISNYGYQKHIRMEGDVKVCLDQGSYSHLLHGLFAGSIPAMPVD